MTRTLFNEIALPLDNSEVGGFSFQDSGKGEVVALPTSRLLHSCVPLLFAQGVPVRMVQNILGHIRISITMDIYTHIIPEVRLEAIGLVGSIFAGRK